MFDNMSVNKFIFLFLLIVATKSVNPQDVPTLSVAICEIIQNFYSKYSQSIDIIDFGGSQGELVDQIMKNLNNSMTVMVKKIKNLQNLTEKLQNQSILLFEKFSDLAKFNGKNLMEIKFINPIRFLVYCQNATDFDILSLRTDLVIPPYYYFIIINEHNKMILLYTFENRKYLTICHESQQLIFINKFNILKLKWIKNPIFPNKYKNFHNCTMVLGTHGFSNFFKYFYFPSDHKTLTYGLVKDILRTIGKILNFKLFVTFCHSMDCTRRVHQNLYLYNVFVVPSLDGYAIHKDNDYIWRYVMLNVQCT